MIDLDLHVFKRVWEKYLKDKAREGLFTQLFTEYKRVLFYISNGTMTLDEAKEYLINLFQAFFGDELMPDEYEAIINELLRVLRLEEIRTRARSRFHFRTAPF